MIIDLQRFITEGRPLWSELQALLERLERDPAARMELEAARRFHRLYRRTASDLARVTTFTAEPELRAYLESIVARAYGEVHEVRGRRGRFRPFRFFAISFPRTVRRHAGALSLAIALTLLGCGFGMLALVLDPQAKEALIPFGNLQGDPARRVAEEEKSTEGPGLRAAEFSAQLASHNTRIAIFAVALGVTFGLGTMILLFWNGVILGAVTLDYIRSGQTAFLAGWLLPHGSIEIPALLIAGQAGLLLGGALLGGGGAGARARLRRLGPDLVALLGGCAALLVWAALVEAFLSQVHEPAVPYALKIVFGGVELIALILFLSASGRRAEG